MPIHRRKISTFVAVIGLIAASALLVDRIVASKVNEVIHAERIAYAQVEGEANTGINFRKVQFTTEDHLRLTGWYVPPKNRSTIILQHGWHANSSSMREPALMLIHHGYGVLLFDFRAQGQSEGETISLGLNETQDTDAAVKFVLEQGDTDADKIGLLGNSMGAATAIMATANNPAIHALAVEGSFAEVSDEVEVGIQVKTSLPPKPLDALFIWIAEHQTGLHLDQVAPIKHIAKISPRPILIIHGANDQRVFPESAQRLFDAAGQPKQLWLVADAAHIAAVTTAPTEYEQRIINFFNQAFLEK